MTNEFFYTLSGNGEAAYQSIQELGAINNRALNKLAEIQFNFAKLGIESSMEQARLLSDISNYEDLLSAETGLATEYGDKVMALTLETTELMNASRDELIAWVEKQFEEGSKAVVKPVKPKPAAKKTTAKPVQTKPAPTKVA
jgi:phasin family protein